MQTHHNESADVRYARLARDAADADAAVGEADRPLEDRYPSAGKAAAATTAAPLGGLPSASRKLDREEGAGGGTGAGLPRPDPADQRRE
jgi:hypothetical protein